MTTPQGHVAGLACGLLCVLASVASAVDVEPIRAGMRLRAALRSLETQGLRIFYSTSVVRHRMRVVADPLARTPEDMLVEILEPVGLSVDQASNGAWLVIDSGLVASTGTDVADDPSVPVETPAVAAPRLDELIVAASRYQLVRDISTSRTTLDQSDLEQIPSMGEDTIRIANRLPGMATNGVSSRSNIRGGEVGEMLVRFDGLRLYDPFHLKDFQSVFSTLDPRVVSSMSVYTGGFPAAYGNRMSGVIDVESMSPPDDRYHEVGLSFFNSSFLTSGRFAEQKGEWVVSARRSNLDLLYDAFSKQPERPGYLDTFGKVSYEINSRLRVSGHFFYASDDISLSEDIDREERAHAEHDDLYYWLRIDHAPNSKLFGTTLLSHSRLESTREGTSDKLGISRGTLLDQRSFSIDSLQTDWSRALSDRLLIQFGGTIDGVSGRYDYEDEVEFDLLFDITGTADSASRERSVSISPSGHQLGAYANVRFSPHGRFTADFGLRWDQQRFGSLDTDTLSPRIGLRYALSERTDLRLSIGRYSQAQYINELQISDGETTYADPQRSDHVVLGLSHEFANDMLLRIEGYEKRMSRLRPRYENLLNSLILLPELKPDRLRIAPEEAKARGFEIMIERRPEAGPSWWVGYSYAWVKDTLDGVDIYRSWDQTHAINIGANWTPGPWEVSVAMLHRSGWPISSVTLEPGGELPVARLLARNANRLDDYRSFAIRAMRTYELERSELTLAVELINAFDRTNDCCTEYEIGDEEEAGELVFKTLTYLPRVPSIGFIWKF